MKIKTLLISFLLACVFQGIYGQEKLQYNLKKGDVFKIKQVADQIIVQEIDGATHEIVNDLMAIMEFKVVEMNEDTYSIDIQFLDLVMTISSSIQGIIMNVQAKEVDPQDIQSKIFNSLLNVPIHVEFAKDGNVLAVQGGDSLVSKMAQASGLKDAFSLNMMKASLKNEFGSEALSNSYKQMTYFYPDKPIEVGGSWENEYAGDLRAQNVWTLDSLSNEHIVISGIANIVMEVNEPATSMLLDGSQDTKIRTDRKSGFIKNMQVIGRCKGYSTMTQLGDHQIPTNITSTVTYELIQ